MSLNAVASPINADGHASARECVAYIYDGREQELAHLGQRRFYKKTTCSGDLPVYDRGNPSRGNL